MSYGAALVVFGLAIWLVDDALTFRLLPEPMMKTMVEIQMVFYLPGRAMIQVPHLLLGYPLKEVLMRISVMMAPLQ